jgi:predicted acetyltransferase
LTLPGGAQVPVAAVSAVSVASTHRRRGVLRGLMASMTAQARTRGEQAAILVAAEYPIYGRFGYGPATDHATVTVDAAAARFLTPGRGDVRKVDIAQFLADAPAVHDALRRARPGDIDRRHSRWEIDTGHRPRPGNDYSRHHNVVCYDNDTPVGYARYLTTEGWTNRRPTGRVELLDLEAIDNEVYARLWRHVCEIDWITMVVAEDRRVDEPLRWMLDDARVMTVSEPVDLLWVRPFDTASLLSTRAYVAGEPLVVTITDDERHADGTFRIDPSTSSVATVEEPADVTMTAATLGAVLLGGRDLSQLTPVHVQGTASAIDNANRVFSWPTRPMCTTFF